MGSPLLPLLLAWQGQQAPQAGQAHPGRLPGVLLPQPLRAHAEQCQRQLINGPTPGRSCSVPGDGGLRAAGIYICWEEGVCANNISSPGLLLPQQGLPGASS